MATSNLRSRCASSSHQALVQAYSERSSRCPPCSYCCAMYDRDARRSRCQAAAALSLQLHLAHSNKMCTRAARRLLLAVGHAAHRAHSAACRVYVHCRARRVQLKVQQLAHRSERYCTQGVCRGWHSTHKPALFGTKPERHERRSCIRYYMKGVAAEFERDSCPVNVLVLHCAAQLST